MWGTTSKSAPRGQCCLCGKNKEQVRNLIVGLHGAVCADCIDLCNDILNNGPRPQQAMALRKFDM